MKKVLIVIILVGLIALLAGCSKTDLQKKYDDIDVKLSKEEREALDKAIQEGRDAANQMFNGQKGN